LQEVRVRFAPSPTGYVHLGSLRTALYNYLFARQHNGRFILRVEDTDQARHTEGAVENLLTTLEWAGLDYDEGPLIGGPHSPYFQSERRLIYVQSADELLGRGAAYRCFCSEERLKKLRAGQAARNEPQKYDGHCRNIDPAEAGQRARSEPFVIRMRIPEDGETVVEDVIRGRVAFQNQQLDDQVLIKSDGYPTYHLANVVDDHRMQITHVIRGEEWLLSTPKHVLLYQYFGWKMPVFAHLPLLLNLDRSKLSKRQGDVAVEDYRAAGYLPDALVNFVALLGWNRGDDQEIFTRGELIESFSLERVGKAGAVFNREKLDWMNGMYIRNLEEEAYCDLALAELRKAGLDAGNPDLNRKIVLAVRNSLNRFGEISSQTAPFFADRVSAYSPDADEWIKKDTSIRIFKSLLGALNNVDNLDNEKFRVIMKQVQEESGVKGKDLWMPVRSALTGMTGGPELPVVIEILGKDKLIKFINQAMEL
jgi:nondiscriminating glutamyl-tRNA synthetase